MTCPRCRSINTRCEWEEPIYKQLPEYSVQAEGDTSPEPLSLRKHMLCGCCGETFTVMPIDPPKLPQQAETRPGYRSGR